MLYIFLYWVRILPSIHHIPVNVEVLVFILELPHVLGQGGGASAVPVLEAVLMSIMPLLEGGAG